MLRKNRKEEGRKEGAGKEGGGRRRGMNEEEEKEDGGKLVFDSGKEGEVAFLSLTHQKRRCYRIGFFFSFSYFFFFVFANEIQKMGKKGLN